MAGLMLILGAFAVFANIAFVKGKQQYKQITARNKVASQFTDPLFSPSNARDKN